MWNHCAGIRVERVGQRVLLTGRAGRTGANVDQDVIKAGSLARHVQRAGDRHQLLCSLWRLCQTVERLLRRCQLVARDLQLLDGAVEALKLLLDRLLQLVELVQGEREEVDLLVGLGHGSSGAEAKKRSRRRR